nr:phospholipase-like protein [Tanacetum cinerariifolium]
DDIEIQFGREEFCLVTGLRFEVDYRSLYSEGLIPFRRQVFGSAKDGHLITAKILEDKIKSKQFFTINDKDAISLCLLSILELVLLGSSTYSKTSPDPFEARSDWWVSSRGFFDGRIREPPRIPSPINLHSQDDLEVDIYRRVEEQDRVLQELKEKNAAHEEMYNKIKKFMELNC